MNVDAAGSRIALDDRGQLAQNVICIRCRYNLRGLAPEAACPECGTPAADSLRGDLLQFADATWTRRIHRGTGWLLAALIGIAVIPPVMYRLLVRSFSPSASGASLPWAIQSIRWAPTIAVSLLIMVSYWAVTPPEPGRAEWEGVWTARRLARLGSLASLALTLVALAIGITGQLPVMVYNLAQYILDFVAACGLTVCGARLAQRIPSGRLARHVRVLIRGYGAYVVYLIVLNVWVSAASWQGVWGGGARTQSQSAGISQQSLGRLALHAQLYSVRPLLTLAIGLWALVVVFWGRRLLGRVIAGRQAGPSEVTT